MKSLLNSCLFAMMFSPLLLAQSGATFYVSTTGSDSNNGSYTAPWLTIQHAANTVTAGATVYVEGGTYHESVAFPNSGTASNPITFASYPGQTATLDGTGVSCCSSNPASSGNETQGLINLVNESYVTLNGFQIQNYTTSKAAYTPAGIWITGSGTGVQLLNNSVHNITTTSEKNGNAFGIAVYGTSSTPITNLTISGNQVYDLKTGESESLNVDGNVTYFTISNNLVHDNDNIGIDAIGFEGVGPTGYDQAKYGEVSGNTVYNISAINNPGEGKSYDADGLYCDGCAYVIFERNTVYACDLNMEAASEHSGHNSSYVTIRNNLFYDANTVGISIGGYAAKVGGSDHVVIVNNSLYNNNTKNQGAEFQVQHNAPPANGNVFENNIVYAGTQNVWIYSYVSGSTPTANWNIYYSTKGYVQGTSIDWGAKYNYKTYAAYQSGSGEDASSPNANPLYDNLNSTPPDLDVASGSPAINAGSTSLTCSVGYCGSGTSIYGSTDYAGNRRINSSGQINIGAYEQ
ncbi:MAG: right-handed parallel beta-helix repeat-containing protein [Candidatus Sulfotelmatobacter sp.]